MTSDPKPPPSCPTSLSPEEQEEEQEKVTPFHPLCVCV